LVLSLTQIYRPFYLPVDKQKKFLELVNSILSGNTVSVHTLQRLAGKCISFSLVVQDSRLFTSEINLAIGRGLKSSKLIRITLSLRTEIQHWADPSVVARVGNWRSERHHQFVIYSDASLFAWGVVFPKESHVCISGRRLLLNWISMSRKLRPFLILFFPLEISFETCEWMRMSTTKPSFEHGSPRQPGLVLSLTR